MRTGSGGEALRLLAAINLSQGDDAVGGEKLMGIGSLYSDPEPDNLVPSRQVRRRQERDARKRNV